MLIFVIRIFIIIYFIIIRIFITQRYVYSCIYGKAQSRAMGNPPDMDLISGTTFFLGVEVDAGGRDVGRKC